MRTKGSNIKPACRQSGYDSDGNQRGAWTMCVDCLGKITRRKARLDAIGAKSRIEVRYRTPVDGTDTLALGQQWDEGEQAFIVVK